MMTCNPEKLKELLVVSDSDINFLIKLSDLFEKTMQEDNGKLAQAIQDHNWDQVRKVGHKLKSSCGSLGAEKLADIYLKIERAPSDDGSFYQQSAEAALAELPRFTAELKAFIQQAGQK